MSYGTSGTSGDGIPVIIKNKIVYGLVDRTVQAYDLGVADYNALSEEEQLDGNIRFIQGVNASAYQSTNSVWSKLGTTPLAEGLPADCSQAINQIKSNLTDLQVYSTSEVVVGTWTNGKPIYRKSYSGACVKSATVILEATSSIDKIISAYGSATSDFNRRWNIPNTVSGDGGYDNRYALVPTTGQLYLQFLANYRTSDDFVFTIEYTKSTD